MTLTTKKIIKHFKFFNIKQAVTNTSHGLFVLYYQQKAYRAIPCRNFTLLWMCLYMISSMSTKLTTLR